MMEYFFLKIVLRYVYASWAIDTWPRVYFSHYTTGNHAGFRKRCQFFDESATCLMASQKALNRRHPSITEQRGRLTCDVVDMSPDWKSQAVENISKW